MNTRGITIVALCCASVVFAAESNGAADGVLLKADYALRRTCNYSVDYTSQGNFRQKASNASKSTRIKCVVHTARTGANKLGIKVERISITSDVYARELQNEIRDKLVSANYALSLTNGFPSLDTSVEMPAAGYLEWDLYRQLAKLLPVLPAKPVKPGFTWERTNVLPMNTARGKVSCEIYRTYSFDKLSGDTAFISWKFRYAGAGKSDSAALTEIPVYGTGNGSAQLDIRQGCILNAEMNFTTPVAVVGDVSIVWHENAEIKLTEGK
jgi:hypothetical protein